MKPPREPSYPNRRRHSRVPFPSPVIVIHWDRVQTLVARDIGAGGVYVYADQVPEIGAPVHVEFVAGRAGFFSVPGRVLRQETSRPHQAVPGFAIQFDVPPERQQEIEAALLANSAAQHPNDAQQQSGRDGA